MHFVPIYHTFRVISLRRVAELISCITHPSVFIQSSHYFAKLLSHDVGYIIFMLQSLKNKHSYSPSKIDQNQLISR